jgi:ATP synthase F1 complex assembly factor 2
MGQIMAVPSQSLAYAIAAEWDAQTKYLQPANMPLMTLACTALDQVVHNPQAYRDQSLNYLTTDTVSPFHGDFINNFVFP